MLKKKCTGITLCILFISVESLILSMTPDFNFSSLITPWSCNGCFFDSGFITTGAGNSGSGMVDPVVTNG